MSTYLLDANVLIALTVAEHEHHDRVSTWARSVDRFALCPITEGALVRFLVRLGEPVASAVALLRAVHRRSGFEFWSDAVSYTQIGLDHVRGHRQVTDAYLVGLAATRAGALMATLDAGLAHELPEHTLLVPPR